MSCNPSPALPQASWVACARRSSLRTPRSGTISGSATRCCPIRRSPVNRFYEGPPLSRWAFFRLRAITEPKRNRQHSLPTQTTTQTRVAGAGGARSPVTGWSAVFRERLVTKAKRVGTVFPPIQPDSSAGQSTSLLKRCVAGSNPAPNTTSEKRLGNTDLQGNAPRSPIAPEATTTSSPIAPQPLGLADLEPLLALRAKPASTTLFGGAF